MTDNSILSSSLSILFWEKKQLTYLNHEIFSVIT